MAQTASQRPSALHRSTSSTPGYFEFNPSTQSDTALIANAMDSTHVHRLDAFHERTAVFEYPEHAHIYAARPLPPVPAPILRKPSSARSLKSLARNSPRRPSLTSRDRTVTTDCIEKALPPLPLRVPPHHRRGLSIESISSENKSESDSSDVPVRRPRAMRSISFRNFLNRNTYPQSIEATPRAGSALSSNIEATRDSRHDSVVIDDMGLSLSKSTTPTSSAPGSRRPSTLSLASLRSRKISQESTPVLPPRPASRKGSQSNTSAGRWALFGKTSAEKVEEFTDEDTENIPPVPITPPPTAELNSQRCYYYSMRNCNGWVIGGTHGDACENCTMHGFFGSP
ncbi:hypothetical protein BDZ85DRAFT_256785 [Elsinoe ampelina]|uniref:Uncharacterized protein n=1 Tax=Elsinoe ampelina TaxID=302913 RepID=A0A6A6GM09_9PEZI|nr:hypothetical protein BDZ85DRAFT_256785 [Elsinoe ampelina]